MYVPNTPSERSLGGSPALLVWSALESRSPCLVWNALESRSRCLVLGDRTTPTSYPFCLLLLIELLYALFYHSAAMVLFVVFSIFSTSVRIISSKLDLGMRP